MKKLKIIVSKELVDDKCHNPRYRKRIIRMKWYEVSKLKLCKKK